MSLSGFSGFSGWSGFSGFSGFSGYSGGRGYLGESGYSGFSGYSGVDFTPSFATITSLTLTNTETYLSHERSTNGAIIFNDILKDSLQRKLTIKNTGVSGTIAITIPTPRGGLATATIPFGWYADIVFYWTGVYWNVAHRIYEVAL